ncbi:MAG TPA: hypothetical protein PK072_09310, partial [Quisquiliibacterium sp.]|nr:hypothetical protein [Quisquiliibacterium sp.]HQP66834.1 hypothetical protein [Quisquiliibacterium sp.]
MGAKDLGTPPEVAAKKPITPAKHGNRPLITVLNRPVSTLKMVSTTSMADTNFGKRRQSRA